MGQRVKLSSFIYFENIEYLLHAMHYVKVWGVTGGQNKQMFNPRGVFILVGGYKC
jgi:hypothetical protein